MPILIFCLSFEAIIVDACMPNWLELEVNELSTQYHFFSSAMFNLLVES
jgi:hypothetical protein